MISPIFPICLPGFEPMSLTLCQCGTTHMHFQQSSTYSTQAHTCTHLDTQAIKLINQYILWGPGCIYHSGYKVTHRRQQTMAFNNKDFSTNLSCSWGSKGRENRVKKMNGRKGSESTCYRLLHPHRQLPLTNSLLKWTWRLGPDEELQMVFLCVCEGGGERL